MPLALPSILGEAPFPTHATNTLCTLSPNGGALLTLPSSPHTFYLTISPLSVPYLTHAALLTHTCGIRALFLTSTISEHLSCTPRDPSQSLSLGCPVQQSLMHTCIPFTTQAAPLLYSLIPFLTCTPMCSFPTRQQLHLPSGL